MEISMKLKIPDCVTPNKDKISELRNSEYLFSFKNVKLLKISYGVTI